MAKKLTAPKTTKLKPTRPNLGIEAAYYGELLSMLDAMRKSVDYWLNAAYRANPPAMAQDATPATALRAAMAKLGRRWVKEWDALSKTLSDKFADKTAGYTDAMMRADLRRVGFSIPFKQTEDMRDALSSVIGENVALIKSIPAKYLADVEGDVMRSVQSGRDLKSLQTDLLSRYELTKKRAAFIARDQNNKATAVMTKARRLSLGITQAEWVHSGGGVHPRQSHVKAGREHKRYDIAKGCEIDGEYIMPGELPNCRCTSRAIIPGFDDE